MLKDCFYNNTDKRKANVNELSQNIICGDLKIKPPPAFKWHNIDKNKLNFMLKSHSKALMTSDLLTKWINKVFVLCVQKYLIEPGRICLCMHCLLWTKLLPIHQVYKMISLKSLNFFFYLLIRPHLFRPWTSKLFLTWRCSKLKNISSIASMWL